MLKNIEAFLDKGTTYLAETCTSTSCEFREQVLSYTHGWVYLLCALGLVVLVAVAAFRRRDMS